MRILHTSDWHIGRCLHGRKRYDEFGLFLDWLIEVLEKNRIDALLVAGDVFDSSTPSNRAQEMYYRFLRKASSSCCRHVVVTAGNHDSPSFLNAPKEILRFLNVHVAGCAMNPPSDEVLLLNNEKNEPELIVCAVPYLRDREIRTSEAGESLHDKERNLMEGIRSHYKTVCESAEKIRSGTGRFVPVVAMGHLFAAGGKTEKEDGVRELYVGSLLRVKEDVFPDKIDYLALGHLHSPQRVGNSDFRRYSGAPLPFGFEESGHVKSVLIVEFSGNKPAVESIPVPEFQEIARVRGNLEAISDRLNSMKARKSSAWIEIIHEGDEIAADIHRRLDEIIAGTGMEILRIRNNLLLERTLCRIKDETLDELNVNEVFERCMDAHKIPASQRSELLNTYQEAVTSFFECDPMAE